MAGKEKKDNEWISWALISFLFVIGWAPLALLLLFFKLFGGDNKKKQIPGQSAGGTGGQIPPAQSSGGTGQIRPVQSGRARNAVGKAMKPPTVKKSNARWLKIGGGILAACGMITCVEPIDMMLWGGIAGYYVEDLLMALAMTVGGGAMFCSGVSMDRALKRYAKYLAVMGDREAISAAELAKTLGYPKRQVGKDFQKMIEKGYFGGKAYFNVEQGYLFRSGEADAAWRKQQEAAALWAHKEVEDGCERILRDIRRANDRIEDPILSAKIDRLEEVTASIFRAVEADPKKQGRIDTFLNYYLPTTQKLLDSYAEFESAGVEGENLRQAKQRIETTMDSIISGFEHQLDQLYKADALDVDSDIRVMETMLRRDTATVEKDFGTSEQ